MDDLTERTPGEDLLYRSNEEEDPPFNPLETCVLDDGNKSFCEPDDECNDPNEE